MKARVTANSKQFKAWFEDGLLNLRVRAPARDGKANEEITKELSRLLKAKVFVIRGLKSRDKEIVFELEEKEVVDRINSLANAN